MYNPPIDGPRGMGDIQIKQTSSIVINPGPVKKDANCSFDSITILTKLLAELPQLGCSIQGGVAAFLKMEQTTQKELKEKVESMLERPNGNKETLTETERMPDNSFDRTMDTLTMSINNKKPLEVK